MISVTGLPNDRDPQRCTAGARGTNFHDFRDRPSKRQSPTEMHRRSGLIFFFFDLCILFPMPFFEKIETRVCITHPFSEKKEKSRRQSCSAHACFVFCHRRLRKKLAGPAFTTQKSKRKLLQIMMVMHRVSLYICVGFVGFPVAPLVCGLAGLAVVRAVFWCSGTVEP